MNRTYIKNLASVFILTCGLLLLPGSVTKASAVVLAPDLVITGVTLDPAFPIPNQSFFVNITIANQGDNNTNAIVYGDVFVGGALSDFVDSDGCILPDPDYFFKGDLNVSLPASSSTVVSVYVDGGFPPGVDHIWAFTDAECTVSALYNDGGDGLGGNTGETERTNNSFGPISVGSPDLVVTGVTIDPPAPAPDQPFDVSITVRNDGTASGTATFNRSVFLDGVLSNFVDSNGCYLNNQSYRYSITDSNVPLGAGQETTSVVTVSSGLPAGMRYIWVSVDDECAIFENDDSNNSFGPFWVRPTFVDVPFNAFAWAQIESIYSVGITGGCLLTPLSYCPDNSVTRAQMAVFLLKSVHGSSYVPPNVNAGTGFADVPIGYWADKWIKQLAAEGITSGCGNGNYCPDNTVTRDQMAVFLLKAKHGISYTPPLINPGSGFNDIPLDYWAGAWVKQLASEGITGGCGNGNYCPTNPVTRAQMAIFIQRTFGLTLPIVP